MPVLSRRRRRSGSAAAAGGLPIGDTFADVDATQLASHVPTGPNPGALWVTVGGAAGDILVRNNEIWSPTNTSLPKKAILKASGAYGSNNYTASASMRFAADPGGNQASSILVRAPDAGTHGGYAFGWVYSTKRWELYRLGTAADGSLDTLLGNTVGGVYADVASSTHAFSLAVNGTTLTAKVDGANAFAPVVDATHATGFGGVHLWSQAINAIGFGYYLDTLTVT